MKTQKQRQPRKRSLTGSTVGDSEKNTIRQYDAILKLVPESKRGDANKAVNEAIEKAVAENITHLVKEREMYKKHASAEKRKLQKEKEKNRTLLKENERLKARYEEIKK